jgi:hypothetical protein
MMGKIIVFIYIWDCNGGTVGSSIRIANLELASSSSSSSFFNVQQKFASGSGSSRACIYIYILRAPTFQRALRAQLPTFQRALRVQLPPFHFFPAAISTRGEIAKSPHPVLRFTHAEKLGLSIELPTVPMTDYATSFLKGK